MNITERPVEAASVAALTRVADARRAQVTILTLLWGAMFFSHAIRYALAVVAPTLMQIYDISPTTMGYILSGWNWAYTSSMLAVGPLVDHFGARTIMAVGSALWGLATVGLPLAATPASLFAMRALFGVGHSIMVPSTATTISRSFGAAARARSVAVVYSGNQVGLAVGAIAAGFILARLGWQAVFYCIGAASLVFTFCWVLLYPDSRRVNGSASPQAGSRVPWLSLFRYRSTWGIAFGQMGYVYAYFFYTAWFPSYLVLDRKMTLLTSGLAASLPFWAGMVGTLVGGWLGDSLIRRGVSPTVSRKGVIGAGLTAATILVLCAVFTRQTWVAVSLLTLAMGCLRLTTASTMATPIDLAPPSIVGTLSSIQNFSANVGGLMAPIVTGYIIEATGSFASALIVAAGMALFGAVCYLFLAGRFEQYHIELDVATTARLAR